MGPNKLENRLKKIKAADVMSKFAITVQENETLVSLAHLMMRFKLRGIPVLSESADICGIVTADDLMRLMKDVVGNMEKGESLEPYERLRVRDLMATPVVTITGDTSLYEVMTIMCRRNVQALPIVVMADHHVAGVIGRREILNAFYADVHSSGKVFT